MVDDVQPDPDQAWKALSLVNDWIRHAETKVAATLAAAGVSGGLLYSVTKDWPAPSLLAWILGHLAAGMLVTTAWTCGMGLMPRRTVRGAAADPGVLEVLVSWRSRVGGDQQAQGAGDIDQEECEGSAVEPEPPEDPVNLLFYSNIVKHYGSAGPEYQDVLAALTSNPAGMTRHVAQQVWANASVAERKYDRANAALKWLLAAWLLMAGVAYLRVIGY